MLGLVAAAARAGVVALSFCVAAGVVSGPSAAQDASGYPARAVRLIVPFSAGATTDNVARLIAQKLEQAWGKPVTVENLPGAGAVTGLATAQRAAPDGHTLVLADNSITINATLMSPLPFDPIKDFAPVTLVCRTMSLITASNNAPFNDLTSLIAHAKTREVHYGSSGIGSSHHIAMEEFTRAAGLKLSHVSYKGSAAAMNDVLGGHLQMTVGTAQFSQRFVREGRARGIAIVSSKRHPLLPDLPTLEERGYKVNADAWWGLLAPAGTPRPVIDKIVAEVAKVVMMDDVRQKAPVDELLFSTPEVLAQMIKTEIAEKAAIIKAANIKIQ